jgi:hypothetical protein
VPLKLGSEKSSAAWTDAIHPSFLGMSEGEVRAALCDYMARGEMGELTRVTWTVAATRAEMEARQRAMERLGAAEECPLPAVGETGGGQVLLFPGGSPVLQRVD